MAFAISTITDEGATLIASATATNALIIDGAFASTTGETLEQLKAMTVATAPTISITGNIQHAGAVGDVARIVAGLPSQTSAVAVRTVWITAHTANDPTVKTLCAVSDAAKVLYVPQASTIRLDVLVTVSLAVQLVNAATVEATTALSNYLTYGDAERFMTAHSAGNPEAGDTQSIYGAKSFNGAVNITDSLLFEDSTATFANDNEQRIANMRTNGNTFVIEHTQPMYDYNAPAVSLCAFDGVSLVTLSQAEESQNLVTIGDFSNPCAKFYSNNIQNWIDVYCDILPHTGTETNIGSTSKPFREIHAGGVAALTMQTNTIAARTGDTVSCQSDLLPYNNRVQELGSENDMWGRAYIGEYYAWDSEASGPVRAYPVMPGIGRAGNALFTHVGTILAFYARRDYLGDGIPGTSFQATSTKTIGITRGFSTSSPVYYVNSGTWVLMSDVTHVAQSSTTSVQFVAMRIA